MGDYGIRVSKTGKDVLTDDDFDMALTSKFSTYKVNSVDSGTFNINAGNAGLTLTFTHNLGYKPVLFAYVSHGSAINMVNGAYATTFTVNTSTGTRKILVETYHSSDNAFKIHIYTDDLSGVNNNESFTFYGVTMIDQI